MYGTGGGHDILSPYSITAFNGKDTIICRIRDWHTATCLFGVILADTCGDRIVHRGIRFLDLTGLLQQIDERGHRAHNAFIHFQVNADIILIRLSILCLLYPHSRNGGVQIRRLHSLREPHGVGIGIGAVALKHEVLGVGEVHRAGQLSVEMLTSRRGAARLNGQGHIPVRGTGQRFAVPAAQRDALLTQCHCHRTQFGQALDVGDGHRENVPRLGRYGGADRFAGRAALKVFHIRDAGAAHRLGKQGGVFAHQADALVLELGHQAVQVVHGLPLEGPVGEVFLLDALQLPLDGDDGLQVPQGDGHPVHLRHLGQVGVRVGEQGLQLLQRVCLPVQVDGLVGDQVALLIQKAQGVQQGIGLLIALAGEVLQLLQQALVLPRAVVQQLAHRGIGRAGQQAHGHDRAQGQGQKSLLPVPHGVPPLLCVRVSRPVSPARDGDPIPETGDRPSPSVLLLCGPSAVPALGPVAAHAHQGVGGLSVVSAGAAVDAPAPVRRLPVGAGVLHREHDPLPRRGVHRVGLEIRVLLQLPPGPLVIAQGDVQHRPLDLVASGFCHAPSFPPGALRARPTGPRASAGEVEFHKITLPHWSGSAITRLGG